MSKKEYKNLLKKTGEEIKKCILLKTKDRDAWLELTKKASPLALQSIYRQFRNRNGLMDKYVLEAFKHEPELLDQLKQKIGQVKKTAMKMEEEYEHPAEMEEVEKQMQNI